jgi:hypothetical protein
MRALGFANRQRPWPGADPVRHLGFCAGLAADPPAWRNVEIVAVDRGEPDIVVMHLEIRAREEATEQSREGAAHLRAATGSLVAPYQVRAGLEQILQKGEQRRRAWCGLEDLAPGAAGDLVHVEGHLLHRTAGEVAEMRRTGGRRADNETL